MPSSATTPTPIPKTTPRRRPSAAVLISSLALVAALAPPAYAALAAGSVGTEQLQNGAVTTPKIKADAVTGSRVLNGSLVRGDLAPAARSQRVYVGTIQSSRGFQDPIPPDGVVGSLAGRFGSGAIAMPAPGRIVVDGYVLLANKVNSITFARCNVLIDGEIKGGSGGIYMQAFYSTQFAVQAAATVGIGSHDVAVHCTSNNANFVDMGVNVLAITDN